MCVCSWELTFGFHNKKKSWVSKWLWHLFLLCRRRWYCLIRSCSLLCFLCPSDLHNVEFDLVKKTLVDLVCWRGLSAQWVWCNPPPRACVRGQSSLCLVQQPTNFGRVERTRYVTSWVTVQSLTMGSLVEMSTFPLQGHNGNFTHKTSGSPDVTMSYGLPKLQ